MTPKVLSLVGAVLSSFACRGEQARPETISRTDSPLATHTLLSLPSPELNGGQSLERVIASRRTRREFAQKPIALGDLGQLAWAAQGITEPSQQLRATPSAGALYPLELYFATAQGVLHYVPGEHKFVQTSSRDLRDSLAKAALNQPAVRLAPCTVVLASVMARTQRKYGERATRYVALEAGHAAQNLLLQATSRGLVGVPIGAFADEAVGRVMGLRAGEEPLYLIPVGYPEDVSKIGLAN